MPESQIKATLLDFMGTDLSVVNAARVSFDKESDWSYDSCPDPYGMPPELVEEYKKLSDKDAKLIHYLAKHGHFSPFGHCFASFRIEAPVFVARQLVKHEYLRMNEVSRRYVDTEPEFYTPEVWRGRSKDKKQGSEGTVRSINTEAFNQWNEDALMYYRSIIRDGVAPEQARIVLPQAMMTSWWWSGSMDAFANMCKLRLKSDTQYETRLVAQQIDETLAAVWPVSWRALVSVGI